MGYKQLTAIFLIWAATTGARAGNLGNVTVEGGGTCHGISGTLALQVDSIPAAAPDSTTFRLAVLVAAPGSQPQFVVAKVTQVAKATSGTAQVFSNGLLAANGSFLNGRWSGTFPAVNAFASVDLGPLTITAGTGPATCTLALTHGQAIL